MFQVNLVVTTKNNCPAIEIRKSTSDMELIKLLVSAAIHDKPITIFPSFSDKFRSLGSLIEKGVIYKEGDQFYFTL